MWGGRLSGSLWATLNSALHFGVESCQRETTSSRRLSARLCILETVGNPWGFQAGWEDDENSKTKGLESENWVPRLVSLGDLGG